MTDSLRISQNEDGSFLVEWNPDDSKWAFLNSLTSQEIQEFIEQALEENLNK